MQRTLPGRAGLLALTVLVLSLPFAMAYGQTGAGPSARGLGEEDALRYETVRKSGLDVTLGALAAVPGGEMKPQHGPPRTAAAECYFV